jgi:CMP-N-acetylneuraminic acid synthetase
MDAVITVTEAGHSPFWMLRIQGDVLRPFVDDGVDYSLKRRQELAQVYEPNGAVYTTRRWLLKERGLIFSAFSGGNTGYVAMDPISSLDIDTKIDFMVVEAVLRDRG